MYWNERAPETRDWDNTVGNLDRAAQEAVELIRLLREELDAARAIIEGLEDELNDLRTSTS